MKDRDICRAPVGRPYKNYKDLLDEFAAAAMQGLLAGDNPKAALDRLANYSRHPLLVKKAYDIAQAMLNERDRLLPAEKEEK